MIWRSGASIGVWGTRVAAALALSVLLPRPDLMAQSGGQGIRAGSFIVKPSLELSESYDSNFFNEIDDVSDSQITTFSPQISVESDFSRHKIVARAGLREVIPHQLTDDTESTFLLGVDGEIDVTRQLRIAIGSGVRRIAQGRGNDETDGGLAGPVYSDRYGNALTVQYQAGDFRIEPFVSAVFQDFIDRGQLVNQDDRDRLTIAGGLELGYRLARGYEGFVRTTFFDVDFQDAVDDFGVNRDSRGVEVLTGVELKLSRLITGRAGLGFVHSQFEDPQFDNTTDFTARVGLNWTPTRRLGLGLNAARELQQTNVAGAADRIQTDATLSARYELLRTLDGSVRVGMDRTVFNGIDRTDTGFFGGFGLSWQATRQASINFAYRYTQEISTDPNEEFSKHLITVGTRYGF